MCRLLARLFQPCWAMRRCAASGNSTSGIACGSHRLRSIFCPPHPPCRRWRPLHHRALALRSSNCACGNENRAHFVALFIQRIVRPLDDLLYSGSRDTVLPLTGCPHQVTWGLPAEEREYPPACRFSQEDHTGKKACRPRNIGIRQAPGKGRFENCVVERGFAQEEEG